jgi:hypothetical protein
VQEVQTLRRDLLATKPAGSIHNNDLDAVLLSSSELHRALTSSGQLTSVRVGSRVFVRPEAIDEFIGSVSTQSEGRRY